MIADKITEALVNRLVNFLIDTSKSLLSDLHDEGKQFFRKNVKEYLNKKYSNYSSIKTILKGTTPVNFYEIYFHLGINNNKHTILRASVENIFESTNFITIIGTAGSGKTTLIKHLFMNTIDAGRFIPILIELRYLNNEIDSSFEKYLREKIFYFGVAVNEKILSRLLESGQFNIFLDGFDEITSTKKQKIIEEIERFTEKYNKNRFIISTRPLAGIEFLNCFHNYYIAPLKNHSEISEFIDLQLKNEEELASEIKKSIEKGKQEYIQSFLTNPLLLSLYILTYQINSSIPNQKNIFYRRVINALFSEHDSRARMGYSREYRSTLSQEDSEKILRAFSIKSYFNGLFDFEHDLLHKYLGNIRDQLNIQNFNLSSFEHDMKVAIALWIQDGAITSFAHRSLHEFFAVAFIANLMDDTKKEKIYTKLIDHIQSLQDYRGIDTFNLLSLCEEMDQISFYKYFYLPICYEIRRDYFHNTEENLFSKLIDLFLSGAKLKGATVNQELLVSPIVNEYVYKSIYIHSDFTRKMRKLVSAIKLSSVHREKYDIKEGVIDLAFATYPDFKNLIINNISIKDQKEFSRDFYKFIEEEINKKERKILEYGETYGRFIDDVDFN